MQEDTRPKEFLFKLVRSVDVTGISGLGTIAMGVCWPDGSCTLYWTSQETHGYYKTLDQLKAIHCYNDNARIEWVQ